MSLIDKLADLAEEKSPGLIEKAVAKARDLADENLNGPERDLAKRALDRIGEEAEALGHLGVGGLVSLLARFHLGEEDQAKLDYLADSATLDELLDESYASSAATANERVNREMAWHRVRDLFKDLGSLTIKVIPLLLMAV